jgi:hypothetical protein
MQRSRSMLLALTVAVFGTCALSASAFAQTGTGGSSAVKQAGAFAAAETTSVEYGPFTYEDARFGPMECSGKHQTNSKKYPGTETEGGRDKFKCKSTTGVALLNVTPGEPVTFAGWDSDYFFFVKGLTIEAKTITGKASLNGKVFRAVAYY